MDDGLPEGVQRLAFAPDVPVVIRVRHELEPYQRRLLAAFGAGYVVDEAAAACAQACGRKECGRVSTTATRWCRINACYREAGAGSDFCEEHGWQEEPVDGRELLDRMDAGEPVAAAPRAVEPAPDDSVVDTPTRLRGRPGFSPVSDVWPRDRIIEAIRAHAERTGFVPLGRDFAGPSTTLRPNLRVVMRVFGSWADAVEAAGYPRPRRGVTAVSIAGLESQGREPQAEVDVQAVTVVSEPKAHPAAAEPSRPDEPGPEPEPEPQVDVETPEDDETDDDSEATVVASVDSEILQLLDLINLIDADDSYEDTLIVVTQSAGGDGQLMPDAVPLFRRLLREELDRYPEHEIGAAILANLDERSRDPEAA